MSNAQVRDESVARPSPLACIECRRKHLKCDATMPVCRRCSTNGLMCNYTPSRRGYRGTKRRGDFGNNQTRTASAINFLPAYAHAGTTNPPGHPRTWKDPATPAGSSTNGGSGDSYGNAYDSSSHGVSPQSLPTDGSNQHSLSAFQRSETGDCVDEDELVNLFYANFHPAHPVLVPKCMYESQPYPPHLRQVVRFIGSHYSSSISSDSLRTSIVLTGHGDVDYNTSAMVQSRLLYAISLHARNEPMEAAAMMDQAVSLAIELGMNLHGFASAHGQNNAIVEESLRRTWWEIFVMDGYMAALHKQPGFKSNGVVSEVLLPCEEAVYADAGRLPYPPSLLQFDGRLFTEEEIQYSSFCYRIEAARILARVLSIAGTQNEDQVTVVDNALAGWVHHLPPAKADVVNSYNVVDEMLFQAHMIIQCATIYLHLPRSDLLNTLPVTANIVCAERGRHMTPASTQHMHSVKATNASKELSNLAAVRVPVQKHTPFFVCGLVLGAIVQLSVCTAYEGGEQHRDRVTLIIGLLKSLSRIWAISAQVLQQVKRVAAEVLQTSARTVAQPQKQTHTPSYDSGIGFGTNNPEVSWLGALGMFENQEFTGLMHLEPIYPGTI